MNQDIISSKWHEVQGKIKQQWDNFTDDEIAQMLGTYQELQGMLKRRYGYQKMKAEKEIDNFLKLNGWDSK